MLSNNRTLIFYVSLVLLLFAGTWMRFYALGTINNGIATEEAFYAIHALGETSLASDTPLQSQVLGLNYFSELVLFNFKLFGINLFALRFLSALAGSLTLLGFVLLLKKLGFSRSLVLLGIFLLSFSFWHLNLSRSFHPETVVICNLTWTLVFLLQGFNSKKLWPFLLAGLLLGANLYFHILNLLALIPLLTFIALLTVINKKLFRDRNFQFSLLVFALILTIFLFPLALQLRNNPLLLAHSLELSLGAELGGFNFTNLVSNFGSIFYLGDPNQILNHRSLPMIPFSWSIMFLFGLILSARKLIAFFSNKQQVSFAELSPVFFALNFLFFTLLLTCIDPQNFVNSKLLSLALPSILIFCLLPFGYLFEIHQNMKLSSRISLKRWRWRVLQISLTGIILTISLSGFSQSYLYFGIWSKDQKTVDAFNHKAVALGETLQKIPRSKDNFLVIPKNLMTNQQNTLSMLDVIEFASFPAIKHFSFKDQQELTSRIKCEQTLFVFYEIDSATKKKLQQKCPENRFKKVISPDQTEFFWTMRE